MGSTNLDKRPKLATQIARGQIPCITLSDSVFCCMIPCFLMNLGSRPEVKTLKVSMDSNRFGRHLKLANLSEK